MKDFIESNIFYKRCDNRTMKGKLIIIAVTVAMLSFSLSACGKLPSSNKDGQKFPMLQWILQPVIIMVKIK